jgi:hypothetical protein
VNDDHDAQAGFSTGDADVDRALTHLDDLDERPLDEHAAVYADIHRSLGSVLDGGSQDTDASS